jgi:hypothetical protein
MPIGSAAHLIFSLRQILAAYPIASSRLLQPPAGCLPQANVGGRTSATLRKTNNP